MTRSYDAAGHRRGHPWSDAEMVALAGVVAGAAWAGVTVAAGVIVAVAAVALAARRRPGLALACVLLGLVAAHASEAAWRAAHPRHLGPYAGWTRLVSDPVPAGAGLRVTVEIQGERFDLWAFGSARSRLEGHQAGEYALMTGERLTGERLTGDRSVGTGAGRRARVRHVVGRFEVDVVGDVVPGNGLARAADRVRGALRASAAAAMGPDDAALFTGLVIGDDGGQRAATVRAFRAAGLAHLTAVSGQNVAFLLAAAAPALRRLRSWWRWAATLALIGWFMVVTRFEPSVLRAGVMAGLAATAFVLGHRPHPVRLLSMAVVLLVLVDPLLVWSVGFWLSVTATLGVCVLGPWWVSRLPGPGWLRVALGVTLGAQLGVAVPSLLVFHRLPVVSLVANPVAAPVAGMVMLVGIPAGLLAQWLPSPLGRMVMAPAVAGTRWVGDVARVAAAVGPVGVAGWLCWGVVAVVLAGLVRRRSRSTGPDVPS